jgi:hypothetical protein
MTAASIASAKALRFEVIDLEEYPAGKSAAIEAAVDASKTVPLEHLLITGGSSHSAFLPTL